MLLPAVTAPDTLAAVGCCTPSKAPALHTDLADLLRRFDVNEFAMSVKVYAIKP